VKASAFGYTAHTFASASKAFPRFSLFCFHWWYFFTLRGSQNSMRCCRHHFT